MPFGLCLMEKVLSGVPSMECLVYLDDLLVHGRSFSDALSALWKVLDRLYLAGHKLHLEKCQQEVSFLGHRVSQAGIATEEDKVETVRDWSPPTNLRQLRAFLGPASYYRQFVPGFTTVAAPLHGLTPWTAARQEAFDALKEALCAAPVLTASDLQRPFILDMDASEDAIGGVLVQETPEGEQVVAYFSQTLNKAKRNYCQCRGGRVYIQRTVTVGKLSFTVNGTHFPPGPRALPIIGNIHIMDLKRPFKTLIELSATYGSVFSIQLGLRKMVVLAGYETVKEALVTYADEFAERPDIPIFKRIARGNGIIFGHGESWKTIRRFTLTALRDLGMGKRTIEIIEESEYLVKAIEAQNGRPFQTTILLNSASSNIIVSILIGHRLDYDDNNFRKLVEMLNESMKLTGGPIIQLYNMYPMFHFLPGPHRKVLRHQDNLKSFFREIFIEHREILDENDSRSYIDAFMNKQEVEKNNPQSHFHEWNLLCSVTNLFVAGTDTLSNTLSWAILLMIKYPDIQKQVHEEIDRVIGGSTPRIQHRQLMPFSDALIHETQRFADIIPMNLPHETTKDVTLRGYSIPKGTYIIPLLRSVHRDEAYWEKPDEFDPSHFLDAEGKFVKRDAFMPFSAGRRVCVGETLARMELFLFFTSLLQRFSFHLPAGAEEKDIDLSSVGALTMAPQPHRVCAVQRSQET
ncbi:cytochrome P450 2K6-like [Amia ocellicauda]|uniref:cytochrome P450 2K6-like n=1 Tax=Amia ocellicauda TaxID=2972642 RepID=UPI0034647F86